MTADTFEPNPDTDNHPAAALTLTDRVPVTDPCGCSAPDAVHQRGAQPFCLATIDAVIGGV